MSKDSGVFNIGSDKTVSLNQVISIIEKELNIESKIDYQPRAFKDVDVVIPDLNRMKSLNWNPTTSIEKGISKTIQWYLNYAEELYTNTMDLNNQHFKNLISNQQYYVSKK